MAARDTEAVSDARRIAACLKACEGIPTENLESGVLVRLVAACIHVNDPEIRETLDALTSKPRAEVAIVERSRDRLGRQLR
jgi:hypothetical protein